MSKQVNPFLALEEVKQSYRRYVESFQRFRNPIISDWVKEQIEDGTVLWQQPLIELNRRFLEGEPLQKLVESGILDPEISNIFVDSRNEIQLLFPNTHQKVEQLRRIE